MATAEHFLVVEDLGDGEFDRTIEHPEDCPTEVHYWMPYGSPVTEYNCGVGSWASMYGMDELKEDPRYTTPGKHQINFWYTPATSMFEDAEAYLEYVDTKEEP